MAKEGPIIIVEDDLDDQELLGEVFQDLQIENKIVYFNNCIDAEAYLKTTTEQPLIIFSDVNLPQMSGTEFKENINANPYLRKKAIPFVFLTTNGDKYAIINAYEMMVQGYFVKPSSMTVLKSMIKMIIDYWKICRHPNS